MLKKLILSCLLLGSVLQAVVQDDHQKLLQEQANREKQNICCNEKTCCASILFCCLLCACPKDRPDSREQEIKQQESYNNVRHRNIKKMQ